MDGASARENSGSSRAHCTLQGCGADTGPSAEPASSRDGRLTILGVRHHSPACAWRVRRAIEAIRPAFVLIEGPSDFNPHLEDLRLPHSLPLAVFSFHAAPGTTQASYAPLCDYS